MTTHILRAGVLCGLVLATAACGLRDRGPQSVGLPYDARLSTGETRREFTILVDAPGATLTQARESARYEATLHCIEQTGFSTVDWDTDAATGDWAVARTEDGEPIVSGRCAER